MGVGGRGGRGEVRQEDKGKGEEIQLLENKESLIQPTATAENIFKLSRTG